MLLKWTPNKLMSGSCEREKSQFWDYALTVNLHDVVYIHCHQQGKVGLPRTMYMDTAPVDSGDTFKIPCLHFEYVTVWLMVSVTLRA